MEHKVNDMLLATLANPQAKPHDFTNNGVLAENTQLLLREDYKNKKVVQDKFTKDGKFDEVAYNNAYDVALSNYNKISNEDYMKQLEIVEYSPFDVTRPNDALIYSTDVYFSKDYNPMKNLYSRTAINSVTESKLSTRELAQTGKIYDYDKQKWTDKSANELGLVQKLFGDTLVYAQWDEDGEHVDPVSGNLTKHVKGDWKIDEEGSFYTETLSGREIYGKQVVNPADILTTDGSIFNGFDFFDADGRERNLGKTALKTIVEIAPLLIPGVSIPYAYTRASIGLASVLPTLYKSLEGALIGDNTSSLTDPATKMEGWMAKFGQRSVSDQSSNSFFNAEQMLGMVSDIFAQIYEQRAVAGLAKRVYRPDLAATKRVEETLRNTSEQVYRIAAKQGVSVDKIIPGIVDDLPDMQKLLKNQSALSKSLSLGYMALTSTADIYGEAINGGFDRRTAGFAALVSTAGMYGVMMNNSMSDWFLDKATGYSINTNRALINKSIKPWFKEINDIITTKNVPISVKRNRLAETATKVKNSMQNAFNGNSVLGEALFKNALVEGFEEVTEQVVMDATKGVVDVMSYLGLTRNRGSFNTLERFADGSAFQDYLANFVGGLLGGAMFELEMTRITPWIENKGKLTPPTLKSIYELVASGQKTELISEIKKQGKLLGNNTLSYINDSGEFVPTDNKNISQAELITNKAIEIINQLDHILNSEGLNLSDEEIVLRGIRKNVLINEFLKLKPEGKHTGLEALVLHDFRTTGLKIDQIKADILELEKLPNQEEQVKKAREMMQPHVDKINSILSGEKSGEYFDKTMFALSTNINKYFGTLDRDNFTKNTYNVNYADLPDTGYLSKERIDKEWSDFVTSSDIYDKIDLMYKSYYDVEQKFAPTISEYIQSGYIDERSKVYDKLIDLANFTNLFDTTQGDRQTKINTFIDMMNSIEKEGKIKILPWESLNISILKKLEENNLINKINYVKNADGTWSIENEGSLNESDPQKEMLVEAIGNITKQSIPTDLDVDLIISQYNNAVSEFNISLLKQIDAINSKETLTDQDIETLENLENSLIKIALFGSDNNSKVIEINKELNNNLQVLYDNNNISKENYEDYIKVKSNSKLYEKSLLELVKENVLESELTAEQKEVIEKLINFEDLDSIEDSEILQFIIDIARDKGVYSLNDLNLSEEELDLNQTKLLIKNISANIDSGKNILNTQSYSLVESKASQLRNEANKKIEEIKLDILDVKNLAFDFLMDALESGYVDAELYHEVEKIVDDRINLKKRTLFKNPDEVSNEMFLDIINDTKKYDIAATSFDFNLSRDYNLTANEVLDLLEKHFKGEDINIEPGSELEEFYNDSWDVREKAIQENLDIVKKLVTVSGLSNINYQSAFAELSTKFLNKIFTDSDKEMWERFNTFSTKDVKLKENPLYNFLKKFLLTLDSNPNGKTATILDILNIEETTYKSSASASDFTSNNIRIQDINQALGQLDMVKGMLQAMTTTVLSEEDVSGFLAVRQNYAKETNTNPDIVNLQTLTSDQAFVLINDIERISTKLNFMKDLAAQNQVKITSEDIDIRKKMDNIKLERLTYALNNISPSFRPDVTPILTSNKSDFEKLLEIEDLIYEHNKNQKDKAFASLVATIEPIKNKPFYSTPSNITKDVKESDFSEFDTAVYFGTILTTKHSDFIKQRTDSLKRSNKAPFYMQDMVIRTILSSIKNPTLFSDIFKLKVNPPVDRELTEAEIQRQEEFEDLPESIIKGETDLAEYIITVLGSAGSGKTTAIMGTVLDIIRQSNTNSKVWLSAPNSIQKNKLTLDMKLSTGENGIEYSSFDKNELFEALGLKDLHSKIKEELQNVDNKNNTYISINNKGNLVFKIPEDLSIDFSQLPNVLVIDEITHFSNPEILLLNEIVKSSDNNFHVIALGDPDQMGYQLHKGNSYFDYNLEAILSVKTPVLLTSVRGSNELQKSNTEILKKISSLVKDNWNNNSQTTNNNTKALSILKDSKFSKNLKYFLKNDELKGTYITKGYIKSDFERIKNIIDKHGRNFVILTDGNDLTPEYIDILTQVGLYDPNTGLNEHITTENIKLLTNLKADQIQGSEVDHIVFDTSLITKYDKIRDQIRSLYTYASRSKFGGMIIDSSNKLNEYDIRNEKMADYVIDYQPLTEEVVNNLKQRRIEEYENILNKNMTLTDSPFMWKGNEMTSEPPYAIAVTDNPNIIVDDFDTSGISENEKSVMEKFEVDDFKIMAHSFYNNLGVEHENNQLNKIKVNSKNPKTDLNGVKSNSDKKQIAQILNEWANLKNDALFESSIIEGKKIPLSKIKGFTNFLQHAFGEPFSGTETVNTKLVITSQLYNKAINRPFAKYNTDSTKELKNGDLFINLTLELSYGDKKHYVTLANLAKESTFIDSFNKYVKGTDEQKKAKISEITTWFGNTKQSTTNELSILNSDLQWSDIQQITGTRFDKLEKGNKKSYKLSELSSNFPGMKFSEIRFFPGNFNDFKQLIDAYAWNQRTDKTVKEMYERLHNKPYIVVNYGKLEDTKSARLLPVLSGSRDLKSLTAEITEIKRDLYSVLNNNKHNIKYVIPSEFNTKFQALLSNSQILDILINWSKIKDSSGKRLTEYLTDRFNTDGTSNNEGEFSILNILNSFKDSNKGLDTTTQRLKEVIDIINKVVDSNGSKDDIIKQVKGIVGWSWNFYNIFVFKDIIDNKKSKTFNKLSEMGIDKSNINLDVLNNFSKSLEMLLENLPYKQTSGDTKFYYNLPLQVKDGKTIIDENISGITSNPIFNDKFFINGTPESARILLPLSTLLKSSVTSIVESSAEEQIEETPEVETTSEIQGLSDIENIIIKDINDNDITPLKGLTENLINPIREISPEISSNFNSKLETAIINFNNSQDKERDKILKFLLDLSIRGTLEAGTEYISVIDFTQDYFGKDNENIEFEDYLYSINDKLEICK